MSEERSMSYSDDGGLVRVQAGQPDATPAKLPQEPQHGERESYRITVNERGEQVVETSRATKYQAGERTAAPSTNLAAIIASAKTEAGFPISGPITGDSIVSHESLGGSGRVKDLIMAGLLPANIIGGNAAKDEGDEEEPAEEKKDEEPEQDPDYSEKIEGKIEGTSEDTDALNVITKARIPETMQSGVLSAVVEGKPLDRFLPDAARLWGMEPEDAAKKFDAAYSDFDKASRQATAAVGVENYEAFWQHVAGTNPDGLYKALSALVQQHDPRALQAEARRYARGVKDGKVVAPKVEQQAQQAQAQEPQLGDVPASEAVNSVDLEHDAKLGTGINRITTDSAGVLTIFYSDGRSEPFADARDAGRVRVSRVPRTKR